MIRGDKVYKVEVKVDNYGNIDYSVISGIFLGVKGSDMVVNLDSNAETIVDNWQLWNDERFYALIVFRDKLDTILKSVNADLTAISEGRTTLKLKGTEDEKD